MATIDYGPGDPITLLDSPAEYLKTKPFAISTLGTNKFAIAVA